MPRMVFFCVGDVLKYPRSGRGYRVNQKLPVASFDAQSNETLRAKAAEVAAGERMLELEECMRPKIPAYAGMT